MKKILLATVLAGLSASVLLANGDDSHMGDHMHNGTMMNHANEKGMTNKDMAEMHGKSGMKHDMKNMNHDMKGMKHDMKNMKHEMDEMK